MTTTVHQGVFKVQIQIKQSKFIAKVKLKQEINGEAKVDGCLKENVS